MRWWGIRKADISAEQREMFEQFGVVSMQVVAATGTVISYGGKRVSGYHDGLLAWLTEQYDRAERKETWSLTMEATIVVVLLIELAMSARWWIMVWG